ncbi:glyoxalase/bleomycin resistance protein/dioxygenase superfamily protein [Stackebrandtia albiflava]|uniref:Glyoxalase/bleomycin resistance protein/dioxygenase superfamily protein n=1 Tax=Stackebrandtia albiflava TaxID=406432 RepID=A0A562URY7_9ACTN|nr:VOC family protein [Stackebrandtia albiflava]TWJ08367.1 glyoxalase/bleomycin resistance protein/dioxygenase superfamily protein [Stackebrandtia albiflava]
MPQPPRQPPRQPARNAARRAAPKATPKATPKAAPKAAKVTKTGGKPAAKVTKAATPKQRGPSAAARSAQHARDAQRVRQRAKATTGTAGGRSTTKAGGRRPAASRGPLRGWRSWWATHEMDRRNREGRRGEAGRIGMGTTAVRGWTTTRAVSAFTLLLLAAFTGSIALGASSLGTAAVAFVFLLGAIAVATAARAGQHYRDHPAEPDPVGDFHIDDLRVDEEPAPGPGLDGSELNTLEDLERSMRRAEEAAMDPTREMPVVTGVVLPEPAAATDDADPAAAPETPERKVVPVVPRQTRRETPEADTSKTTTVAAASAPVGGSEAAVPREETDGAESAAPDAPDESDGDDPDRPDPESGPDEDAAAEEAGAEPEPEDPVIAALLEPLVEEPESPEADEPSTGGRPDSAPEVVDAGTVPPSPEVVPVSAEPDDPPMNLLAAETAGVDLLSAYAEETALPPEAVRDVAATLIVSDLDASFMFYTELLGLVEIDRARDAVLLEAGFGRVLLWRRDDAPKAGYPVMHLTFEVGDVEEAYRTLSARGVRFTHAPRSALSGEVHDLRAASFLDPDGHGLAITELRQRATGSGTADD